ncbi:MAG: glycine cleavage system protein H, partial [Flavobacteriia bacterium]|nr:glycine cleavage system protein H [Flavobacteriia bacterium]
PIAGTVVEMNEALEDTPELVNTDPYGAGWMIKIELEDETDTSKLLDATAYQQLIGG